MQTQIQTALNILNYKYLYHTPKNKFSLGHQLLKQGVRINKISHSWSLKNETY